MSIDGKSVGVRAIAQAHLVVVLINYTVRTVVGSCLCIVGSAYIFIYQHTRTNLVLAHTHVRGDVVLLEVFLNILERTEHTDTLHSPSTDVCTTALGNLAIDIIFCEVHYEHLVVVVTSVQTDTILEVFTNLVAPGDAKFPTPVVHLTKVLRSCLRSDRSRNLLSQVQQHLAVLLVIPVEVNGQSLVQYLEVQTEVGLIRLVPVNIGIQG